MPVRDELQTLWDAYTAAYRAGDAAGCAAVFVPDGAVYSPYSPPAHGRPAIEVLHREWTQVAGGEKQLTVLDAGSSGALAWSLTAYSEGDPAEDGTSLSVLERQADGGWLIRLCSLNKNAPG